MVICECAAHAVFLINKLNAIEETAHYLARERRGQFDLKILIERLRANIEGNADSLGIGESLERVKGACGKQVQDALSPYFDIATRYHLLFNRMNLSQLELDVRKDRFDIAEKIDQCAGTLRQKW